MVIAWIKKKQKLNIAQYLRNGLFILFDFDVGYFHALGPSLIPNLASISSSTQLPVFLAERIIRGPSVLIWLDCATPPSQLYNP